MVDFFMHSFRLICSSVLKSLFFYTDTSLQLTGLENGKEYQLRIVAIDKNQKIVSNILSHVFTYKSEFKILDLLDTKEF